MCTTLMQWLHFTLPLLTGTVYRLREALGAGVLFLRRQQKACKHPPSLSLPPPPRVQRTLCPTNTTRSNRIFCVPN